MTRHHTLHKSITIPSYHILDGETRRLSVLWFSKFPRRKPMRERQRTWQYATYHRRSGLCVWILGFLLLPLLAQAEQFTGKVVGIRTGDTLSVLRKGRVVQVRLYGVACPQRRQAFSTQ